MRGPEAVNLGVLRWSDRFYVTFGPASNARRADGFTIETWFKRTAAGLVQSTSNRHKRWCVVDGRPWSQRAARKPDGHDHDMNYCIGLRASRRAGRRFEEGAAGRAGTNHPPRVHAGLANVGIMRGHLQTNDWRCYLNGSLEAN